MTSAFSGTVDAQGSLRLHDDRNLLFVGVIDASDKITGG